MARDALITRAARNETGDIARVTEQTPLLTVASSTYVPTRADSLAASYRRNIVVLCFAIIFLVEVAVSLFVPASTAIAELNICHEEYPGLQDAGAEDYSACKGPQVQGRLAMLQGWQLTAECLPGIIGAIPYGLLADKWGRRPVIILSLGGYTLYILYMILVLHTPSVFSPEAILFGPIFALIGGSTMVASAMAYTMIADVVPVAERATVFFQFGATVSVAELISNPLAGTLTMKSNWLSVLLGLGLWIVATVMCFLLPETLDVRRLANKLKETATTTASDADENDTNTDTHGDKDSFMTKVIQHVHHSATEVRAFATQNRGLVLLMLSLVFVVLGRVVQNLLLQFTTKKFAWTWPQATFLLTVRSSSSAFTSLVLLPFISHVLTNTYHIPPVSKDTYIARATGGLGVLGSLLIAFAPSPLALSVGLVVFGFSGGMAVAVRSLLNALVESHHVGMLNTVLGLLEQVGLMAAGPLFSKALKTGIELGGGWIGLPFLVAGAYMCIATGIVVLFNVPKEYGSSAWTGGSEEGDEEHR